MTDRVLKLFFCETLNHLFFENTASIEASGGGTSVQIK